MKQLEVLPGSHIKDNCDKAYEHALNGESVMFRHNGVQIIMFPDTEWLHNHAKKNTVYNPVTDTDYVIEDGSIVKMITHPKSREKVYVINGKKIVHESDIELMM